MSNRKSIEEEIYSTFSNVAYSIGYSPLHGRIIGVLLVKNREMSLQEIAKETGYSTSMVSLSLDLLEIFSVIKKIKKTADRNLYVSLQGDLLECLKNAFMIKVRKSIVSTLSDFEENRKNLKKMDKKDRERIEKIIDILENEIKRLDRYITLLSRIKLP